MKGFMVILVIAVCGVGYWGNTQSKAKAKAVKELAALKKEMSQIDSANKKLESTVKSQEREILSLKGEEKVLNAKLLLQKKNVEVLEGKVSSLESMKSRWQSTQKVAAQNNSVKNKPKASKQTRQSREQSRKIAKLKYKVKVLSSRIGNYKSKARNAKYAIVKLTQNDAKGWYYRRSGSIRRLHPMSSLPDHWSRSSIRIVYISKKEKQEKMKKEYLAEVDKLEREKLALTSQLASLQK